MTLLFGVFCSTCTNCYILLHVQAVLYFKILKKGSSEESYFDTFSINKFAFG